MDLNQAFKKIETHGLANVFNIGLFNRFNSCERNYLDHIPQNLRGFIVNLDMLHDLILSHLGEDIFVCVRTSSHNKIKELKNELISLSEIGLELPDEIIQAQLYSDDDELYYCYSFFEWTDLIKPLLWMSISNNYSNISPKFDLDIFFVSKDVNKLINVYDDRGVDILNIPTPPLLFVEG